MSANKNEQLQTNEILDSTAGMSRAEMPSFFYTRLMARMEKENTSSFRLFSKPVLSLVTLTILLVLNITVVMHYVQGGKHSSGETNGIQSLASEMNRNYSAEDKTTN